MPNIVSVMMAQILRWLGQVGKMNRDKIPRIFLLRKIVGRKKNGRLRGHWKRQEALDKNSNKAKGLHGMKITFQNRWFSNPCVKLVYEEVFKVKSNLFVYLHRKTFIKFQELQFFIIITQKFINAIPRSVF